MERTAGVFGSCASPLESIPSTWKTFSHRTRDHLFDAANNVSRRQLLRHMDIQHIKITEDPIEHVHSQPGDIRYNNGF